MIDQVHIRSAFDADLEKIQNLILEMGGLAEAQIGDAAEALGKRDFDLASKVIKSDKRIDALEQAVDTEVMRVLALRQPIAQDLRAVVTVIKIAGNLERIGDHAKNNSKRIEAISAAFPVGSSVSTIRRMSRAAQDMLRDVLDSYVNLEFDLAEDVRQRDEEIDLMYNGLFRELLTHMMEDPRNITPCMHLLFVAKNVERMGDHITGIAEQVIVNITGEMPGSDRLKGGDDSYGNVDQPEFANKKPDT